MKISKFFDKILFDNNYTCNVCGKEIFDGKPFCSDCEKELKKNNMIVCACCGRSVPSETERCWSCNNGWSVDKGRSLFLFEGEVVRLIHKFKYDFSPYIADIFMNEMAECYIKNMFACDLITCVPMTENRKFERGFNHSEYLAKSLSELVKVPFCGVLEKRKETEKQAALNYKERAKNLESSFAVVDKEKIKNKRILIVDDVLTTGATSNEIAKTLKAHGADKVMLITLASTVLKN